MGKMFTIKASEAHGRRLDPEYHHALRRTRIRSTYPSAKLLSLSYFRTGGTPSTAHPEYWNGSIPWVSAKDFKAFRFEDSEDHVTELAVAESTTCYVNRPAVLMVSRSGILQHTLPVMVTHKPTTINQDIKAFFPDDRVSVDYLGAFFDVFGSRLLPLVCKSGATVQSLNTEQLMDLSIPLPPLSEQRKIVAELDAAYAAKRAADEKATKLLASIDDMVLKELGIAKLPKPDTSLSSRIFTVPAKEVHNGRLDPIAYQSMRRQFYKNVRAGAYEVLQLNEIVDVDRRQTDSLDGLTYVGLENINGEDGSYCPTNDKESISTAVLFQKGEILFPKLRPYLNKVWLSDFDGAASTEFFPLIPTGVSAEYLIVYLRLTQVARVMTLLMTGNTLPRVQLEDVLSLPVPIPPRPVQDRIASTASSIRAEARKLKADATAALDAAKRKIEAKIVKV
jgi:restriction endonuclease S subunit